MKLKYFTQQEFSRKGPTGDFINWFPRMSQELLIKLDLLRFNWGKPIHISPHNGAIGRFGNGAGYHYWETHGEVMAVDTMPEGIESYDDAMAFIKLATKLGFTGIGFYPNWKPQCGFHLDVRPDRDYGNPAMWGAVNDGQGQYTVTLSDALNRLLI